MDKDQPTATVREVDGQLVLEDPVGFAIMTSIERLNLYNSDPESVKRLEARAVEKSKSNESFGVVIIDVDVATWTDLVEALMPNYDWQQFRDRGEKPIARGVVPRGLLMEMLGIVNEKAKVVPDPFPTGVFTAVFGMGGVTVFEPK